MSPRRSIRSGAGCRTFGVLADIAKNSYAYTLPLFNLNIEKDFVPTSDALLDALETVEGSIAVSGNLGKRGQARKWSSDVDDKDNGQVAKTLGRSKKSRRFVKYLDAGELNLSVLTDSSLFAISK